MTRHKYSVGQIVDFDARVAPKMKTRGPYKVMKVLPFEDGGSQRYYIKSQTEPFERTANEYEIIAAG
jgi:hypothetical protein